LHYITGFEKTIGGEGFVIGFGIVPISLDDIVASYQPFTTFRPILPSIP
jgi:hypothetical protein